MRYIITCSPYFKNEKYLLQFSMTASNVNEIIEFCNNEGIYYKTIVSIIDYMKMNYYQLPLHEIN